MMPWEVYTASEQIEAWIDELADEQQEALMAAIELLQEHGPTLGRPIADRLTGSRHQKMKELRPPKVAGSVLRVLFAFDNERRGALLVGGDKAEDSRWNQWYDTWVPIADDLLDDVEGDIEARRSPGGPRSGKSRRGGRR
jgi:hypothetical protein